MNFIDAVKSAKEGKRVYRRIPIYLSRRYLLRGTSGYLYTQEGRREQEDRMEVVINELDVLSEDWVEG
jgi:hypothetical protein